MMIFFTGVDSTVELFVFEKVASADFSIRFGRIYQLHLGISPNTPLYGLFTA
jgi:hypothetical protein